MHSKLILFAFVCSFASVLTQHDHAHDHNDHSQHRVNVGVYYESLCPDSRKFFTQQLYPSLQGELAKYVNLTLAPYGKSTTKTNLNDLEFECHHGPSECWGNKLHICALKKIGEGKNTEGFGFNKIATGFVNCLMDKSSRNDSIAPEQVFQSRKDCALLNNVENLNIIENCVNHPDGSTYLSDVGKLTDAVQKPLTSVPTIVFNNQYKVEDVKLSQTNFVKALCQYIADPKPAECTKSGAATQQAGLLAVGAAVVMAKALF